MHHFAGGIQHVPQANDITERRTERRPFVVPHRGSTGSFGWGAEIDFAAAKQIGKFLFERGHPQITDMHARFEFDRAVYVAGVGKVGCAQGTEESQLPLRRQNSASSCWQTLMRSASIPSSLCRRGWRRAPNFVEVLNERARVRCCALLEQKSRER